LLTYPKTLEELYPDIVSLESHCRFDQCLHISEPGCAVLEAVEDGRVDRQRLVEYRKAKFALKVLSIRGKNA
jgi:ribosome biogenesis GTPase